MAVAGQVLVVVWCYGAMGDGYVFALILETFHCSWDSQTGIQTKDCSRCIASL